MPLPRSRTPGAPGRPGGPRWRSSLSRTCFDWLCPLASACSRKNRSRCGNLLVQSADRGRTARRKRTCMCPCMCACRQVYLAGPSVRHAIDFHGVPPPLFRVSIDEAKQIHIPTELKAIGIDPDRTRLGCETGQDHRQIHSPCGSSRVVFNARRPTTCRVSLRQFVSNRGSGQSNLYF
jgi:hypothetical protein